MKRFYSKGYVCYLRASQMNDLIKESVCDKQILGVLKKIETAYQSIMRKFESRHSGADDVLKVHSSLFSNEMFIFYLQSNENVAGIIEDELRFVLDDILELLTDFRKESVTLEGGITYDDVYHSGNINIGPAIVKAVLAKPKMESGIWLDKKIIEFIENNEKLCKYISDTRLREL